MKLLNPEDYPKSVLINGETYRIVFQKVIRRDKKCLGLCDPNNHTIYIKLGQGKVSTFETFIHECFHALEEEYSLKVKHSLIHELEAPLVKFFVDNF